MGDSVENELKQVKQRFDNSKFQERRKTWDDVANRNFPTELPAELTGSQEGLDYQTPDVLKTIFDHIDVLVMNQPLYDLATLQQSDTAREAGRRLLLWTARGWEYENEGRWWDRTVAEGQVRHGLKVMAQRWRKQVEAVSTYADKDEDEAVEAIADDAAEDADKSLSERKESFKRRRHPFYWTDCDLNGCYWLGDERSEYGPDVFFYKYELPYAEAKEQLSKEKEKFSFDKLEQIAWVGEDSAGEEEWSGEKVYVTVRDGRKLDGSRCPLPGCDHPQRVITVYAKTSGEDVSEEDQVEEIDSPFPGCSYFIIPGRISSDTDPDNRYIPLLYALYVEAVWQNYLNTLLATAIRQDYADEDLYIDMSKVPPHVQLPEGGEMTFPKSEPGSNEIQGYPGPVLRYPKSISAHLVTLLEESRNRLNEFKMNRFLAGQAYTEASNATASAFKSQYEQAALPFNALLAQSSLAQLRSRRYEYHAIRYWALSDPEDDTRFYAIMTGSQQVRTTRSPKGNEAIWIDAATIESVDFDLRILTKSETLAEQEQRWFLTKDQYVSGVATPEDLLRAAGYDDLEGQMENLRAVYVQEDINPLLREATKQMLIKKFSLATGFDLGALIGQPVFPMGVPGSMAPMLPPGGQAQEQTAGRNPVINARNALNTPGEQVGSPQGMTPGSPPV